MYSVFELIFPWTINLAFQVLKFNIGSSDPIYYYYYLLFFFLSSKKVIYFFKL